MAEERTSETVVIVNPKSGSEDHTEAVRKRAELEGYRFQKTEGPGDAITLARDAAEQGASTIVAAGGDGTVNEVVQGIDRAEAFDSVTLGIVPAGTGNNFAENVGITDIDTAFHVLEDGERRRIDLGRASDRLFINSCVAGLTAEASSETSTELKGRVGVLAYVITTIRSASDFEPLQLTVDSGTDGSTAWAGEALCVLVGNGRRFTIEGSSQANLEDGLFEVAVVEDTSGLDLMEEALVEQLLGRDAPDIEHIRASQLDITIHDRDAIRFSLDGEIIERQELSLRTEPRKLELAVGDTYDPYPD